MGRRKKEVGKKRYQKGGSTNGQAKIRRKKEVGKGMKDVNFYFGVVLNAMLLIAIILSIYRYNVMNLIGWTMLGFCIFITCLVDWVFIKEGILPKFWEREYMK